MRFLAFYAVVLGFAAADALTLGTTLHTALDAFAKVAAAL